MSPVDGFKDANFLKIYAGTDASFAKDTFIHIPNYRGRRVVDLVARSIDVTKGVFIYAIFLGQGLKLAVLVSKAGIAFAIVLA
jgi:hypothetical protein